jgi:hypothetical protein
MFLQSEYNSGSGLKENIESNSELMRALLRLGRSKMGAIEELIKELPPDLQKEVEDFARFLLERRAQKRGRKLRQDWAGALREYRDQFTSLELQKKALEWRGD